MVDDLITDHKKSEVGTNALGGKCYFPNLRESFCLVFWDSDNEFQIPWIFNKSSTFSFNCKNAKLLIYTTLNMLLGIFPSPNSAALEMLSPTDRGWEIMVMLWAIDVSWLWPLESGSGPSTWPYGETLIICWNGSTTCSNSALWVFEPWANGLPSHFWGHYTSNLGIFGGFLLHSVVFTSCNRGILLVDWGVNESWDRKESHHSSKPFGG